MWVVAGHLAMTATHPACLHMALTWHLHDIRTAFVLHACGLPRRGSVREPRTKANPAHGMHAHSHKRRLAWARAPYLRASIKCWML